MGDIINSRSLEGEVRERVTQAAKRTFDGINTKYRNSLLAHFGMVRGDSFEGVLITQFYAPQIVQDIIKAFYRVEKTLVRVSVVMGQLTVRSSDRNEVDGPVFTDVMAALEKIKERGSTHWLQVSFDIGTLGQSLISSQIGLLTALTERWTDKQREICWIAEEIEGHEAYPKEETKEQELYKLVAKRLSITPAVVKKQLNSASYGAYRQAWDGITEYLALMDEYTGKDNVVAQESFMSYFNIAQRKMKQHSFSDAIPLLEKSLTLAKDKLDKSDTQLIQLYISLAVAYSVAKKYQKADDSIQMALSLQESLSKTQQYVETLKELSTLHYFKKEYVKAKDVAEKTQSIARDILPYPHPYWGEIFNALSLAYVGINDYEKGLYYSKKDMDSYNDSPHSVVDYAIALFNVSCSLYFLQRYDEAADAAEKALELYELNLPMNHEYINDTRDMLGLIQNAQKGNQQ